MRKKVNQSLLPDKWPDSSDEEVDFELHLIEAYPTDDPRLEIVLGKPESTTPNIRFRVVRDMIGWVVFQKLIGEFTISSLLLALWSVIATIEHRIVYALIYAFVGLQIIAGVHAYRATKLVQ